MPADITIVGLGPGDPARRTRAVQQSLNEAERLFLRTADHPGTVDLAGREDVVVLDAMPRRSPGDWSVEAAAVCDAAAAGPVVLAVPGHPRFGERLVIDTVAEAERRGQTVDVLDGLSAIDMVSTALGIDPMVEDVQIVDARQLVERAPEATFDGGHAPFTPRRPMLFSRVYGTRVSAPLSRILLRVLPPEHPVVIVLAAGIPGEEQVTRTTVSELATIRPGHLASVWVPALDRLQAGRDPRTLQHIVARLRQPDGCPWDRKQTTQSLRDDLIEELYEAVDAVDAGDMDNLAEELGDLLLLVMMQAQIAEEVGAFTLEDVFEGITRKIVRRHPHVFGEVAARDAEEVVGIWQRIKAEERAGQPSKPNGGMPRSLPALDRASRILRDRLLDPPNTPTGDRGADLLAVLAGIIADGDDPDVVLRRALDAYVTDHG